MDKFINIDEQLISKNISVLNTIQNISESLGYDLYLVGGAVRDLLLGNGHNIHDIDLAVEGNTSELAEKLKESLKFEKETIHSAFNTVTFEINEDLHIDIAMCRTEKYPHPASLPIVQSATIYDDLQRRDFTINAMAIMLTGPNRGMLIDQFDGYKDLNNGIIKVLHKNSFIDDPTRLWRAIRYAARFDYCLDFETHELFAKSLNRINCLTPERLKYELECFVNEPDISKVLELAQELGLLGYISEKFDSINTDSIDIASTVCELDFNKVISIMSKDFSSIEINELCQKLGLSKQTMREIISFNNLQKVEISNDKASIYSTLSKYSKDELRITNMISTNNDLQHMIDIYLTELSDIEPYINGTLLKELGVTEGPLFGEKLNTLVTMQINGIFSTQKDAIDWIKNNWILK